MLINTERIFQFHVRLQHWGNCSVESNLFTKINVNLFDVTRKSHRTHPIHLSRTLKLQRKRQYRKLFWRHKAQIDNDIRLHHRVCFAVLKTSRLLGKQNSCYHKDVIIYGNNSC